VSGDVRRIASGGPWEDAIGYSRAVVAGPFVLVSGCTATVDGEVRHPGDAYAQALTAFGVATAALGEAGLATAAVVRTRMYLKHQSDADAVGRAHREVFGEVRPAATMVVVAGFIDPRMLVEVEVVGYRGGPDGAA
jgi:enamine deaminase RidA (YjgF/YER057c/UK114 family)